MSDSWFRIRQLKGWASDAGVEAVFAAQLTSYAWDFIDAEGDGGSTAAASSPPRTRPGKRWPSTA